MSQIIQKLDQQQLKYVSYSQYKFKTRGNCEKIPFLTRVQISKKCEETPRVSRYGIA